MKNVIYTMLALTALLLASCSDVVDDRLDSYTPADQQANTAAPQITSVYAVTDTAHRQKLTTASLGQMVRITGSNLNHAKSIKFNGVEVDLADTYTAATEAITTISATPSFDNIDNVEYTTDLGTTTYPLTIVFPDLVVDGLENEFVQAGDTVHVTGSAFNLYGFDADKAKVTLNGNDVKIEKVTPTYLNITIPAGTPDNSTLQVSWTAAGNVAKTQTLQFRPSARLLYPDLSAVQHDKTNDFTAYATDADVTSTVSAEGTKHLHFTGDISAWSWTETSFAANLPDLGNIDMQRQSLVFEILTDMSHPLPSSSDGNGILIGWNWGDNYAWEATQSGALNTQGRWQTVRIPLSKFNADLHSNQWTTLKFVFQFNTATTLDFRMANFRIE